MENEELVKAVLDDATKNQKIDYDCGFSSGFLFSETPLETQYQQNTWYSFGYSEGVKTAKLQRFEKLLRK